MKRSTLVRLAVYALCWILSFAAIVFSVGDRMEYWQLAVAGGFLALLFLGFFAPNTRYNP